MEKHSNILVLFVQSIQKNHQALMVIAGALSHFQGLKKSYKDLEKSLKSK